MSASARLLLETAGDRLPSPNGVALAIMDLWEDERATVQQMSQLVQTDPGLSGRLLKLANSAAMGGRAVAAIPEAIVRVGMQTVGQLVVAFSLIDTHGEGFCASFKYQDYWSHCLLMALLSRELAQATRIGPPDDLFACGLLSRIGMLAFATIFPDEYGQLLNEEPENLAEAERQRFGVDHNELSEVLMIDYGVPKALAEPARFHEAPEASGFAADSRPAKLATLLHWAHRMAAITLDSGQDRTRQTIVNQVLISKLGIDQKAIGALYDRATGEWQEWSKLLELPQPEAPDYAELASAESDLDSSLSAPAKLLAFVLDTQPQVSPVVDHLRALAVSVVSCCDSNELLRQVVGARPQILVLPADEEGCKLCRLIRSTEWGRSPYIFMMAAQIDEQLTVETLTIGADTVISTRISRVELDARLLAVQRIYGLEQAWRKDRAELRKIANELAVSHRKQELLSLTDQLTELPNRRAAMLALQQAWARSTRTDTPIGVAIIDVDHFKNINDRYGHAAGDRVLQQVAAVLKTAARQEETIARIGGEEFLLISSNAGLRELVVAAERLRRQIQATPLTANNESTHVTLSMGIAEREATTDDPDELLNAADKALYAAKSAGRNQICLYQSGKIRALGKTG